MLPLQTAIQVAADPAIVRPSVWVPSAGKVAGDMTSKIGVYVDGFKFTATFHVVGLGARG